MRFARFGVGAAFLFLVSTAMAQQPSPKDLIVGEWVMSEKKDDTEIKAVFVFSKDHKAMATLSFKMGKEEEKKITINASYDWVGTSDDTIEMTTRPPGATEDATEKVRVKVTEKELSMSGKDGKELKFTRVKQ